MKKLLLLIVILSVSLFAKTSKDVDAPTLTPEQKIELLKLQRNAAVASAEAQTYLLRFREANQLMQDKIEELIKGVDQTKWTLDFQTLEFSPAPPQPAKRGALPPDAPSQSPK